VFVSYAREDREHLERVLPPLDAAGVSYWFDEHLNWDDNWWDDVRARVRAAHAVIVLMSPHAAASDWVTRELLVAQEHHKAIFPILLEGKVLPQLSQRQYLDLSDRQWPPTDWLRIVGNQLRSGRRRRVRRATFRGVALSVPAIASVVLVTMSIVSSLRDDRAPIPVLDGDYNVGVAQFRESLTTDLTEQVEGEIKAFVPGVVAGVKQALDRSPDHQGSDLELLRIVVGNLPVAVDDTGSAVELAAQSNADVLLYGSITTDGASVVVAPILWLSSETLPRAEELSGVHLLPASREDVSRPDAAIRFRRLIAETATDLAELTQMVRLYDAGKHSEALEAVRQARERGFVQAGLLDILEGNLAGKLERFDDARAAYKRASADPAYAERAGLGLAQVRYIEALGSRLGCGSWVDVPALYDVIDEYVQLQADRDPLGANIHVKAMFGEARARMCLDASGHGDDDGRGRALLEQVIEAHDRSVKEQPDDDLRELAAEAEGLLGDHDARRADNLAKLRAALEHLAKAGELSTDPVRRSGFALAQAQFLAKANELDEACAMVREARELAPPGLAEPTVPGLTCS
jgi:tetratricopeptide (TPR) repeat protein